MFNRWQHQLILLMIGVGWALQVAATPELSAPRANTPAHAAATQAATPAAPLDALLASLARPTPAQTPFVELRGSALLKKPQRLQGRLQQPDANTLVREVLTPFHERTTIRAERVLIERYDDRTSAPRTRTFSLRRAPELASLLSSFTALLGGNRALLEKNFVVRMQAGPDWQLQLIPRDPRLLKQVSSISLRGRGNALECMRMLQANGQRTTTLLGMTAVAAARLEDAAALDALCAGKPAVLSP